MTKYSQISAFKTKPKRGSYIVLICCILCVIFFDSSVMRESDQAAILAGAIDITWGGDLVGNNAYRYDKFYGTYWLLGCWFEVWDVKVGVEPMKFVQLANIFCSVTFLGGFAYLSRFVRFCNPQSRLKLSTEALVFFSVFTSPVVFLSIGIVSANILSVSCLLVLIGLLCVRRVTYLSSLAILLITFFAVACRADAVLVLPALVLMGTRRKIKDAWRCEKALLVVLGGVIALVVGRLIAGEHASGIGETFFFKPQVIIVYLICGIGVPLAYLMLLSWSLLSELTIKGAFASLVLLLPLGFYIGLLFSPRHLLLLPVIVLASCVLPRGRLWWKKLMQSRHRVALFRSGTALSILTFCVGIVMPSFSNLRLSWTRATCYPTADGYWPLGGTLFFKYNLAHSTSGYTIDHNQEVWQSWCKHSFEEGEYVLLNSLTCYPELVAKLQGVTIQTTGDLRESVFCARNVRRHDSTFGVPVFETFIESPTHVKHDGEIQMPLMEFVESESVLALNVRVNLLVATLGEGHDIVLYDTTRNWNWKKCWSYLHGHEAYLISEEKLDKRYLYHKASDLFYKRIKVSSELNATTGVRVIAVRRLPNYMRIRNYTENSWK